MTARKFKMISAQESGIGGILLLFVLTLLISLIVLLIMLPGSWVVLIFRRNRHAPVFFVGFLGGIIVLTFIDMYFGSRLSDFVHTTFAQHGRSTAAYDAAQLKSRYRSIGSIGWTVARLLYWRSSERVRPTFAPGSGMKEIPKTT
jgi:hypothetical protein